MIEADKSMHGRRLQRLIVGSLDAIVINGPFDFNDAQFTALTRQIIDEGKREFAIDLSKTTYISSLGIASLFKVIKQMKLINGVLTIIGASEDMIQYLAMARIDHYFQFMKQAPEVG